MAPPVSPMDRNSSFTQYKFRGFSSSGDSSGRNSSGRHSLRDRHSSGSSFRERSSSGGRDGCRDRTSSWRDRNSSPDRVLGSSRYELTGTTVTEQGTTVTKLVTRHESGGQEVTQYVGEWEKERDLGCGSYGAVHLERNVSTNDFRAVKRLTCGRKVEMRELACLILVKNFSRLFVTFHGWYKARGDTHLAMEYQPLGDLGKYILHHGVLSEKIARDVAEQILQGVFILHENRMMHRDIKPENILVVSNSSTTMTIKLADFGLAKQSEGPAHTITGTLIWRAPEQTNVVYNDPVDMWAVGCVVFYLLTSLNPFFNLTGIHETRHQNAIRKYTFPFWPRLEQREFTNANRQLGYRIVVPGTSNSLNGFLSRLIIPDPPSRMSAHEALSHEWICPRTRPLDSAVGQGDMPLARLLSKYDDRFEHPWEESTLVAQRDVILEVAAKNGNYDLVRETIDGILARSDSVLRAVGWKHMKSALVGAAAIGNIEILELLRVNLAFPEKNDNLMLEAFTAALKAGHHETVEYLWSHVSTHDRVSKSELNIDIACRGTTTLLNKAIKDLKRHNKPSRGAREILHSIKPGADESAYEYWFQDMVIGAAQYGNIDNFKFLLETPPSPVPKTLLSDALVEASSKGHLNIVNFLLARGVFPSQSATDAAVSKNHNEIFRSLANALRSAHDKEPLQVNMWTKLSAIPYCGLTLLRWLIKQNCAPDDLTPYLRTASYFKDQEVVDWFLASTDNSLRRKYVAVAFVGASEGGHIEIVESMLDQGAAANILDAWVGAAKGGHTDVLQLLLSKNPEPSEKIRGRALRAAIRGDHLGAVMQLLYCSGLEAYVDNANRGHRIIDIPCNQVISDFLREFGYHV